MDYVVATSKVDIHEGQEIDGLGGYLTYGLCENAETAIRENLLPMGLAEGCCAAKGIPKDSGIRYSDITLPEDRLSDRWRSEQDRLFFPN